MKLYATTTSERATKGQGGNNYIDIVLKDHNERILFNIVISPQDNASAPYSIALSGNDAFLKVLKNKIALYLDLKPQGNKFDDVQINCGCKKDVFACNEEHATKGEKQKLKMANMSPHATPLDVLRNSRRIIEIQKGEKQKGETKDCGHFIRNDECAQCW